MIRLLKIIQVLFLLILFPKTAYSLTSSSYLIVNEAILLFDYETAVKHFDNYNSSDLDLTELRKKIISFVNSNRLKEVKSIAKQIIELDNRSEDAWLVLLTLAILDNDLSIFREFETLSNKNEFIIINHIFYENNKLKNNNEDIAGQFLDLIHATNSSKLDSPENIDYYLFYLNLALNFKPQFNEVLFIQAQLYQELKYYLKAEKLYNKIQPQHTLFIEAQKNIVVNKKKENKFEAAEKQLIRLMDSYPEDNSLIVLLADLYRVNNQYNKGIKFYTLLIDKKKINNNQLWRMYYLRGICYERSNKWEKAENDFLHALKIEPEQPQVLNYLAYGWIEKNLYLEKSIEMLNKAVKQEPKSHYILDSLAWAYYKKNDLLKALEIMEKVIEIAPSEAISLDHLGDIYFSLGRQREGYFMWIQALDLAEPRDNISESIQIKIDKYNAG